VNVWPKEDLPALEAAFKNLGRRMYEIVCLLAKQIDALTEKRCVEVLLAKKPFSSTQCIAM
jgi:hypothetical protein